MAEIDNLVPTTELEAVNAMLATTGDSPVASITPGVRADVDFALNTIRLVCKTVQSKGWLFNTDREVTLTPDGSNHLVTPDDALRVKKSLTEDQRDIDIAHRQGRLWDILNNTDLFSDAILVDITRALDFEDLPETARALIFIMAGRRYQQQTLGNIELSGFGAEDEKTALANLVDAEGLLKDTDYLNNFPDQRMVNKILRAVSREVQTEGWKFNLRLNVPIEPDDDLLINLPGNTLLAIKSEIAGMSNVDCTQRGLLMYNVREDTDEFDPADLPNGSVYLDITEYLELADLPDVALKYIKIKAARQIQAQRNADQPQANGYTDADEILARRNLVQAEGRKEDYSLLRNMATLRTVGFRRDLYGRGKVRRGPTNF